MYLNFYLIGNLEFNFLQILASNAIFLFLTFVSF